MLMPSMPASASAGNALSNSSPLVVSVTQLTPSVLLSAPMNSTAPFLISGSPPVTLNLFIPDMTAALQTFNISSYLNISE